MIFVSKFLRLKWLQIGANHLTNHGMHHNVLEVKGISNDPNVHPSMDNNYSLSHNFSCLSLFTLTGLHCITRPIWGVCQDNETDYASSCTSVDSRLATDADLYASHRQGHSCCNCGFTNNSTLYLEQSRPCGWSTDPTTPPAGVHPCSTACDTASNTSNIYCMHDTGQ